MGKTLLYKMDIIIPLTDNDDNVHIHELRSV